MDPFVVYSKELSINRQVEEWAPHEDPVTAIALHFASFWLKCAPVEAP